MLAIENLQYFWWSLCLIYTYQLRFLELYYSSLLSATLGLLDIWELNSLVILCCIVLAGILYIWAASVTMMASYTCILNFYPFVFDRVRIKNYGELAIIVPNYPLSIADVDSLSLFCRLFTGNSRSSKHNSSKQWCNNEEFRFKVVPDHSSQGPNENAATCRCWTTCTMEVNVTRNNHLAVT